VSKKKYGALGAHIYAGGHTLGVRATKRFDTGVHLEEGTFGAETSRRELGVEVRVGMDCWNPSAFRGGVDWLYSNPPCAAWSSAGTRRGAAHDLARHTERVFDLMPAVKPTVFSWECVTNVATAGKEFVLERARQAIGWGYDVHLVTLEVADLGLPSMRKRFFFVASKVAMQFPSGGTTVRSATSSTTTCARRRRSTGSRSGPRSRRSACGGTSRRTPSWAARTCGTPTSRGASPSSSSRSSPATRRSTSSRARSRTSTPRSARP
jgi:hypothetical protein